MKRLILVLECLLPSFCLYGQISITDIENKETQQTAVYDSLKNFLGYDYQKYLGQDLYVLPKNEKLRIYGYSDFKIIVNNNFQTYNPENSFSSRTKYDSIAGQYFTVIKTSGEPDDFTRDKYLILNSRKNGQTLYFLYDPKYESSFPFLVVGYFEKLKKTYSQKNWFVNYANDESFDLSTGNKLSIAKGSYYCEDVTIDSENFKVSLLLLTPQGNKFLYQLYDTGLYPVTILPKTDAEKYKRKFGSDNWQSILDRKLKIGFTEEMVKMSWGEPLEINRSSNHDQWVYRNQYLYFENGLLTDFN
ncbi:hypothetical protein FHS59_002752 [Algoriphagus iocasae]|uniref:Uncharacterized protein n=1 Tax=Algoriphagus iocasae TaxID=1836499 RepID=A0A841MR14_9BACT|nr:hypothetical protein [Algoriphagus iocasae]MBB6327124.1 hypothetical protein [Algoriphagus iocasae]